MCAQSSVLDHDSLAQAKQVVYAQMPPTPAYAWPLLGDALDCEVWVKHENHTPTGAFKVRGGLVYMANHAQSGGNPILVTATRGNHGQSIPFAARLHDQQVHVFVPDANSAEKNAAMRAWGATLHVAGSDFDEARQAAQVYATDQSAHMVPSYHEWLVQGVATYASELFERTPDIEKIYVPIGLGSGAAAVIAVRDLLGLSTQVIGVVSSAADAMARSVESGEIVSTMSAHTFADGVATRMPDPAAFAMLRSGLARTVRVTDDEVSDAMRLLYRTTHNVAEGAGAVATAAAMQERELNQGKKIAVILTGGNIDQAMFAQVLSGVTPTVAG